MFIDNIKIGEVRGSSTKTVKELREEIHHLSTRKKLAPSTQKVLDHYEYILANIEYYYSDNSKKYVWVS